MRIKKWIILAKRGIILIVALGIALLLSSMAQAFQNEPDGFRGIKWGDPPGKDMRLYEKGYEKWPYAQCYVRRDEKLQIGKVKLENIYYLFHKNKFMRVLVEVDHGGVSEYYFLKDVLTLKFGRVKEEIGEKHLLGATFYRYCCKWVGSTATVILRTGIMTTWAVITLEMYSNEISDQYKEYEFRRKEEELKEGLADFDLAPTSVKQKENKELRGTSEKEKTEMPVCEEEITERGRYLLFASLPTYPEWAEKQGLTGKVELKFWVLPGGEVCNTEVLQTSGYSKLDNYAIESLRKWRFTPIDKPEVKAYNIEFHFSLLPTKHSSVYNVDSLSSSKLPPVIVQGEDKSYLKVIKKVVRSGYPSRSGALIKRKEVASPPVSISPLSK